MVDEFLASDSSRELSDMLQELGAPEEVLAELAQHVLLVAMDRTERERAALAGLLSSLCVRGAMEASSVEAGVELVLRRLPDLELDVPKAAQYAAEVPASRPSRLPSRLA